MKEIIIDQSVENADVAFVKGANERSKFFEKKNKQYYCIKPTLPVRYKHVLTGENRALTGENVY